MDFDIDGWDVARSKRHRQAISAESGEDQIHAQRSGSTFNSDSSQFHSMLVLPQAEFELARGDRRLKSHHLELPRAKLRWGTSRSDEPNIGAGADGTI